MKFTTSFVLATIAATSRPALGLPTLFFPFSFSPEGSQFSQGGQSGGSSGAAFWMTNEPTGNMIMVANVNSDGQLSFSHAVSAGGLGQHGVTSPNGPDGLFSQGAVKTSSASNILATINPGSNTASVFSIDPQNPTDITMIGNPVSTEGEFPMSLTINSAGTQVCVLNGGQVNGVNCYKVDKQLGLTPLPNTLRALGLNQTTPANGPAGSTSHIVFSEDGTKLIASVKGVPPTPGFLATWDVASDGSLSPNFTKTVPASGGLLPFSMTIIQGKNAILATDAGIGFDIFDFSKGDSASSTIVPINGQKATCWSSFSSKTGNFYLTDIGTATVTEVHVDSNLNGTIVKQYPQAPNSATMDNDVATVGNKDFLYVLASNATSIDVLSLQAPGQAKSVQTFNFASAAKQAKVTINPNNLQGMSVFVKA